MVIWILRLWTFGAKFQISGAIALGRKFPDNRSIYPTVAAPPGGSRLLSGWWAKYIAQQKLHWTTLDHTGPHWTTLGGVSSSGANGWSFLAEEYLCSGHAFLPNPSCSYPTPGRINYHSDANTRRRDRWERDLFEFSPLHLWLPRLSRLYLGTSVHYLPPSVHPNITLQRTAEVDLSVSTSLFFPMSSQTLNLLMKKARRPDHLQQEKNNPERAVIAKSPLK